MICVLRLSHRKIRDQRVSTHVFLVARAFGADEGVLCGELDKNLLDGIAKITKVWGGNFKVRYEENWRKFLIERKKEGWKIVHLTMYGLDFEEEIKKLKNKIGKKDGKIVVVVGSQKVPPEVYQIADINIAVYNQPHSEVAALAIFLDRLVDKKTLEKKLEGGVIKIIPDRCMKKVIRVKKD